MNTGGIRNRTPIIKRGRFIIRNEIISPEVLKNIVKLREVKRNKIPPINSFFHAINVTSIIRKPGIR